MFEIRITISCPDLVAAATLLTKSIGKAPVESPAPETASVSAVVPAQAAAPVPAAPVTAPAPSVVSTPKPEPAPAPAAFAAPVVPLAQAPGFTLEQISRAGAELITVNPGILPQVNALLGQFCVQTLDKLKPEQLGPFATALRGLGAKI